ncbi:MAG: hypothetical protein IPM96_10385 [Ignavibacteria bacterium]|nr:hypothetical protein [Ignavibacteria bacterium]
MLHGLSVSNFGNDLNSGLSEDKAWRTLNRVSVFKFQKGDVIQFRGGDLFKGNLLFNNESGTDTEPIRITSYGLGRAVFRSDEGSCVSIINNGGFVIENLEITGLYDPDRDFAKIQDSDVDFRFSLMQKLKSNKILIRDCIIRNFKNSGISLEVKLTPIRLYKYTTENNTISDCGDIGVGLWGLVYQGYISDRQ